jgi:hypothetical protein
VKKTIEVSQKETELELKDSKISGSSARAPMVDSNAADKTRRTALLGAIGIAGAAGLPSEWKKPVIDSLVLPAHAQMSPTIVSQSSTAATSAEEVITISEGTVSCRNYQTFATSYVVATKYDTNSSYYVLTIGDARTAATLCEDGAGGITSRASTTYFSFTASVSTSGDFTYYGNGSTFSSYCNGYTAISSYTSTISVTI